MARKKKALPPGVERLDILHNSCLEEHASAGFLDGMLNTARHAVLNRALRSEPKLIVLFQKFIAELMTVVRDTEHQMVAHEFATFLALRISSSPAASGQLTPVMQETPREKLILALVNDFLTLVRNSREAFYTHELADLLLSDMEASKPLEPAERRKQRKIVEAYAYKNFAPVLQSALQDQANWVAQLEDRANPKEPEFKPRADELAFCQLVGKA